MTNLKDRTLWKHLERSSATPEIAAMVAPRMLIIDRGGADAEGEYRRARPFFEKTNAGEAIRYSGKNGQHQAPGTAAIEMFDEALHPDVPQPISPPLVTADPEPFFTIAGNQFAQWQARYRNLAIEAYADRDRAPETRHELDRQISALYCAKLRAVSRHRRPLSSGFRRNGGPERQSLR